jgi:hypothetical protein
MTETKIRKRLADFCINGDIKKVKAIYTIIEHEIEDTNDMGEDFIKELDRRKQSFLDGTAKTYTWEETRQAGIDRVNKNKNNGVPG